MNNKFIRALRSTHAAIDLASIMVGVVVVGIIGGVISATVFAVIPWAQDNAAKAALSSIATAESAVAGIGGMYTSFDDLVQGGYMQDSETVNAVTSADSSCYVAVSLSPTGKIFYIENTAPAPKKYTPGSIAVCNGVVLDTLVTGLN